MNENQVGNYNRTGGEVMVFKLHARPFLLQMEISGNCIDIQYQWE